MDVPRRQQMSRKNNGGVFGNNTNSTTGNNTSSTDGFASNGKGLWDK